MVLASSVALMITKGAWAGLKKLHKLMIEQIFTSYVIQEHTSAHSYFRCWLHSLPEAQSNIVECSYDRELEQVKTKATTGGKISMHFNGVRIWINPGRYQRPGSQRPGDGHDDNSRPRGTGTVSEDDISQKTYITLIGKDHKVIDEIIAKGKAIYDLKKIEKTHISSLSYHAGSTGFFAVLLHHREELNQLSYLTVLLLASFKTAVNS